MEKRLTIKEVTNILLKKDYRTIMSYVEKGLIPKIALDEKNMTIDSALLAKELGVEDFDEPFIDENLVREILELPKKINLHKFCKDAGINMYQLSNKHSQKFFFRESDIKNHAEIKIELLPFELEKQSRKNIAVLISEQLIVINIITGTARSAEVLKEFINGYNLKEIGERLGISRERVRQILFLTKKRLSSKSEIIKEWLNVWGDSRFANMRPENILKYTERIVAENFELKNKLLEKISEEEIGKTISGIDGVKYRILDAPISALEISPRLRNCLTELNIESFRDILNYPASHYFKLKNVGNITLLEIKELVSKNGFQLRP